MSNIDACTEMLKSREPPEAVAFSSAERGIWWLRSRQRPSGEFAGCADDLAGYYQAILAFGAAGRSIPAGRCCRYVTEHFLTSTGELASGDRKTGVVRLEHNLANYMNGWVAVGAWSQDAFELAERVVRRLEGAQSARHGGVLTGPANWSGRPRYDLATTASCGRAFLITGHRDAAMAAGRFLTEALLKQRDPERWLDLSFEDRWTPVDAVDPAERTYFRLDRTAPGEKVWFPAFASGFLCELHEVTGEPSFLDAARAYFAVIDGLPECRNGTLANGKSGWAAALLARATGGAAYEDAFARIFPNVLARQRENGSFDESPVCRSVAVSAAPPADALAWARLLERSAELTTWVTEYSRLLAGPRAGGRSASALNRRFHPGVGTWNHQRLVIVAEPAHPIGWRSVGMRHLDDDADSA
jgi:hypothetical protein